MARPRDRYSQGCFQQVGFFVQSESIFYFSTAPCPLQSPDQTTTRVLFTYLELCTYTHSQHVGFCAEKSYSLNWQSLPDVFSALFGAPKDRCGSVSFLPILSW